MASGKRAHALLTRNPHFRLNRKPFHSCAPKAAPRGPRP